MIALQISEAGYPKRQKRGKFTSKGPRLFRIAKASVYKCEIDFFEKKWDEAVENEINITFKYISYCLVVHGKGERCMILIFNY